MAIIRSKNEATSFIMRLRLPIDIQASIKEIEERCEKMGVEFDINATIANALRHEIKDAHKQLDKLASDRDTERDTGSDAKKPKE